MRSLAPALPRSPNALSKRGLVFGLSLALTGAVACATRPPPVDSAAPPAHASRAVLISIDGMSGQRLERLLETPGALPARGLNDLAARGFFAVRSVPSTPSLTPAAHATHVTGALPRDTGIVGNSILDRSKPFGSPLNGFDTPLRAETLCEAAHRQGRRVGVMAYPHGAGTPPTECAGFGMNWVASAMSRARVVRIPPSAWQATDVPIGKAHGFSPPVRMTIDFPPTAHRLVVRVFDSTDDGVVNYDRLRVEPEVGPTSLVSSGEWFAAEVRGDKGRAGAWCKILSLAPDLSRVEIYVGGISETDAYPAEFRRDIDARAGFWPGRADYAAFGPSSERAETYREQSDRLTAFLAAAATVAEERPTGTSCFSTFRRSMRSSTTSCWSIRVRQVSQRSAPSASAGGSIRPMPTRTRPSRGSRAC